MDLSRLAEGGFMPVICKPEEVVHRFIFEFSTAECKIVQISDLAQVIHRLQNESRSVVFSSQEVVDIETAVRRELRELDALSLIELEVDQDSVLLTSLGDLVARNYNWVPWMKAYVDRIVREEKIRMEHASVE